MGINLPLCYFKSDMNTFQCKSNVQVVGKSFCHIFMLQQFICLCPAIAAIKQRTTEMSFVSSIGPRHPISEIATSHIYWLKKTRNKGDQKLRVFLIKRVRTQCYQLHILSVKWLSGCSEVGDPEMYQKQVEVTPFYDTIFCWPKLCINSQGYPAFTGYCNCGV